MRVEREGQAVVTDVVRAVAGLGHGAEGDELDSPQLRFVLRIAKQGVQRHRYVAAAVKGLHLVAQIAGELPQAAYLEHVGLVVNTINEGFCSLNRLTAHLSAGSHIFRHVAVCKKHEFLDEPVGLARELLMHTYGLSLLVHIHLHFRAVEIHRAAVETSFAQFQGQLIQDQHRLLDVPGHFAPGSIGPETLLKGILPGVYDALGKAIVEAIVGNNMRAAEPWVENLGLGRDFKHGRER